MKKTSAAFEIRSKDGRNYTVKYRVATNTWDVYRMGTFISSVTETRSHQFKNETRAKDILKSVLNSRKEA